MKYFSLWLLVVVAVLSAGESEALLDKVQSLAKAATSAVLGRSLGVDLKSETDVSDTTAAVKNVAVKSETDVSDATTAVENVDADVSEAKDDVPEAADDVSVAIDDGDEADDETTSVTDDTVEVDDLTETTVAATPTVSEDPSASGNVSPKVTATLP